MNNATHERSIHPATKTGNARDDSFQSSKEEPMEILELNEIKGIRNYLDQVNFTPRAASIRAIMKYAHKKNEAVH
jgi:hypothetical protein